MTWVYFLQMLYFGSDISQETFLENTMTSLSQPHSENLTTQPSCNEYLDNITLAIDSLSAAKSVSWDRLESAIKTFGVPLVSVFGIIGNLLNLIVLTRKRLQRSMDHMEKSAQMGLVALAVSDMMVCVVYLVASSVRERVAYTRNDWLFGLYFYTYQEPMLNIFQLSSTWLTVTMALSRYLAVCRPMHARGFISLRGTRTALIGNFVGSLLLNLPRFWHYVPVRHPCSEITPTSPLSALQCPCFYHVKVTGALFINKTFVFAYSIVTSIVGIFAPLLILTGCNVCLVLALRRSHQLHKNSLAPVSPPQSRKQSRHRITPTLISLIVLFIVLVAPSEILRFFRQHVVSSSSLVAFQTWTDVFNFLPLINFAVNFVLYCVVNVHFRQTCRDVLLCRRYLERKGSKFRFNNHMSGGRLMTTETGL